MPWLIGLLFVGIVGGVAWVAEQALAKQRGAGGGSSGGGSSGWTLLTGSTTVGPGVYRISVVIPAGTAAAPTGEAGFLQQAMQAVGWTSISIYMPGATFPSDWPDTDPTELRIQATLPSGVGPLPIIAIPGTNSKAWIQS